MNVLDSAGVEKQYPSKLYNTASTQSNITYLNQTPVYYENITLTSDNIGYGSGTYDIYTSSIDDTNITYSGINSTLNTVAANSDYAYITFPNNGTLTVNSSIICDILVVGGGGGGGSLAGPGGGAGALIYKTNYNFPSGSYTINIGAGGAGGANSGKNPGLNGGDTSIINNTTSTTLFLAKGGGGGSAGGAQSNADTGTDTSHNGNDGGSGGGGYKSGTGGLKVTTNIPQDNDVYGNNGASAIASASYGGGGGGAGGPGIAGSGSIRGNGGLPKLINITNTPTYYAGGGGTGNRYYTNFNGLGGAGSATTTTPSTNGGAGDGGSGSTTGGSAVANTGSGGGGGGYADLTPRGGGGAGGSGIIIIRFLKSTTKKELFNYTTNDNISSFKSLQYNALTGYYLSTNRYINNYYGDWIIIKNTNTIFLTKYRIYNTSAFIGRSPSLFKIYGSINGFTYEEIINASNNTNPLTSLNYASGYYEKIINNFEKAYLYFALVVNKIIGGNSDSHSLNITEFQIFGSDTAAIYVPKYLLFNSTTQYFTGTLTNTGTIINNGAITGNGTISAFSFTQNGTSLNSLLSNTFINSSNYTNASSNLLLGTITSSNFTASNFTRDNSNILLGTINTASNTLQTTINSCNFTASNFTRDNSNILLGTINTTSNLLRDVINSSNTIAFNFTTITSNTLQANMNASNILASNIFLSKSGGTITSNLILNNNLSAVLTEERQYPPKAYTSISGEVPITFLGQSVYTQTITLNTTGITYGSGDYILYSSSVYVGGAGSLYKGYLFNYDFTSTNAGGHWNQAQYSGIGVYLYDKYIKPDYLGEWLIVKLPNPIVLTQYRFYPRLNVTYRLPGEFKFYGSMNGTDFTEITQASQISRRLTTADIVNGYYEKTLASDFNTPYLYIGFAVNKLIGTTSDPDCLNFHEFQIFGKQVIISNTAALGIGTTDVPSYYRLMVRGGAVSFATDFTNTSSDDVNRFHFVNNGPTYLYASSADIQQFKFRKSNNLTDILTIYDNDTVYASSKIGIGITNPSQNLAVIGTSYFNGNVGIGTTNPLQQLHLNTGALYITGNATVTGDTASASFWNQSGVGPTIAGANIAFRTNGSTEVMRITSTGNVGIGTTNPESKLDIILPDNINITTNVLGFKNTANYGIYATSTSIENRGNTLDFLARDYNFALANITTRNILSLRPEGNVGIGITNPAQRLSVAGNSYISGNVGIGTTPSTTSGNMLRLHTTFAGANDQLLITGTSTIGVTNIRLSNGGTGVADAFIGLAGTAYGATGDLYRNNLYLQSPSSIVFNTQGNGSTTANMIIVGNGNVGIGTTNPGSYLLNVAGSLNATSFFSNTLPINFNSYATTTELAGKENTLTFSSPLTRTTNTIGINLSGYATTSNLASYLPLSGGTMTGALNFKTAIWNLSSDNQQRFYFDTNGTTFIQGQGTIPIAFRNNANADIAVITSTGVINAVLKLQEAGVDISTKYLSLAAATNDLSGKLAILNGNPLNTPQLGDYGGTGDRLILWKGNSGAYPYSLGMNGSTMWYSVPGGAIHNFYVNGVSKYQINSGGVAVFGNVSTQTLAVVDVTTYTNQYQLLISSPTSTTPARIQTIQQNMGYTQNLILQGENLSGNVGIGTLTNITSKLTVNGDITASATVTASSFIEGGQALSSKYLQSASLGNYVLKAGDTMTGALNITSTTTDNQLIITNTATNRFASIRFFNGTANGFIGVGCTAVGGTYQNNLFIEANNSIIFSSANATSATSPPRMILNNSGNLGINVASPIHKLHVQGASPAMIRIETNINAPGEISGIEFGIPAFSSVNSAKITSTAIAGDKANLQFFTTNGGASSTRMLINETGNVGIGTTNPNASLEVYSNVQLYPKVILSGTDFSTNTTSSSGVAFLLGSNLTNDRQLWIADSSAISVGTTNPVIRIMPNTRTIDAVATNGTTPLSLGIGNTGSSLFLNGNNIYGDASQLNNFKFENNNQSNLIYPPPIGTSTSLTRYFSPSASNMQAGTYIMSASSNNATAYLAFDKNLATEFTISSAYNVTTGNYNNSGANITSTFVSGTDIRGEWIQLNYNKGFVANSITISGITGSNAKCPKDFIIAGSKDSSNWILLSSQVGIGTYSPSNIISIYNFTSYNFYRLIVTKTISDPILSIADISFSGNPNTSFIPLDNYNILLYNTNEKQFPPRVWDVAPTAEALSSNEIFNIAPASYYRQQFSLNNHGTYVIYSSSTNATANLGKNLLFDYDLSSSSAGGHWLDSNYIITLGNYLPSGTSRIGTNTYYGDWIIIKLPFQILLTRFRFYSRTNAHARAPGLWRCYGSNDGVNWIEITDASNSITKLSKIHQFLHFCFRV